MPHKVARKGQKQLESVAVQDSAVSEPQASILNSLDAKALDALPFQLHPQLLDIWKEATDKQKLADLIDADGGIRDALLCAEIPGHQRPILYDGMTRLAIWFERQQQGKVEAVPKYEVQLFTNLGDVINKVIAVQTCRRNASVAQIAFAGLEAMRRSGYDISPKSQGRQSIKDKADKSALNLKPLPRSDVIPASIRLCHQWRTQIR